jgi:WD40-like Beta Propeller Repeat
MRLHTSSSLLSVVTLSFGVAAGFGCAGVKPVATSTGGNGGGGSGNGGSGNGNGGSTTGNGGGGGTLPVTPISGSFSCTDFDTSGACASFSTSTEGNFNNATSGSTSIAYPLDQSLFPSNLGPIQIQMTTSGSAARITFQTTASSNVNIEFFGSCESAPGSGCSVTIPLALTQMLIPACQTENIQITASVLNGTSPTADSAPVNVAWTQSGVTGGLYYWTVLPNQSYCPSSTMASPGSYCLQDTTLTPKNGTAIYRYDFSQDNPAPEQVWTDDGGPQSAPPYQGGPQSYVASTGQYGAHCIGCHSITNDGKYMALGLGGSSTYNGSNWAMLDIAAQALDIINPTASTDANSSPTNDPSDYWKKFRKDAFGVETAWGPNDDVAVTMYKAALYFNTVTPGTGTAAIAQSGPALPSSAAAIDPYQSDPFWSHDGKYLVYTSFNTPGPADTYDVGGLDGDLKTGGQIAIADATTESITDDASVLVPRQSGYTDYYPCVSEDSNFVVYNQSSCGSNPMATDVAYDGAGAYGGQVCDGYDDSTAKLWWVSTGGTGNIRLDNANGGDNVYDNSWPRFSPDVGTFRGQTLYWIAFSSRRPYGAQLNTSGLLSSQPQLWFAAVTVGELTPTDPSWSPVWLPGQNTTQANPGGNATPVGNHVPQWVRVAIVIDQP